LGLEFGTGWSGAQAVNYSPNDRIVALLLNGGLLGGEQPVHSRTGPVGGLEAGYNWQAGSNWLFGLETDFSLSDLSDQVSGSSVFFGGITQTTAATQRTDWYGTVRARAGFLATPNLLLFGSGGFAYARWRIRRTTWAPSTAFRLHQLWRQRRSHGRLILVHDWRDVLCGKFVRNQDRLDRRARSGMAA
jgi:outer membrane immunogenic protein